MASEEEFALAEPHEPTPEEEALEREAFLRVVAAFRGYEEDAAAEISRWEYNYAQLSPRHKALLPRQPAHFAAARAAAAANAAFFAAMLATYESPHVPPHLRVPPPPPRGAPRPPVPPGDAEKVRYVLRNLSRDWSADGAGERAECYAPMLAALRAHLPPPPPPAPAPRVLVPGAGLGRLCVEAAAAGYAAEGNECSYYMLLTSSFIMNHAGAVGDDAPPDMVIHPWATSCCNNVTNADAIRAVIVPDLRAGAVAERMPPNGLSMAAGEFCDVYGQASLRGSFDAALTCFFLDTSHNVLATIDVLAHALRPGAVWINCGPLLYHWADAHTYLDTPELSIELPLEDVKAAAVAAGFQVQQEGWADPCGYAGNDRSLMHTRYRCATWTMVRR